MIDKMMSYEINGIRFMLEDKIYNEIKDLVKYYICNDNDTCTPRVKAVKLFIAFAKPVDSFKTEMSLKDSIDFIDYMLGR
jgi:hypothetical protein